MNKKGFLVYYDSNKDNCNDLIKTLEQCSDSKVIVVNDRSGDKFSCETRTFRIDKKYYAASVNEGLRVLNQADCEHIFIIRDNVILNNLNFVDTYINCFKGTGIHILFNTTNERVVLDYKDTSIKINDRFLKHFIYLNRNCIKQIGYLDEKYQDSFEILDYYYRLFNKGLTGPIGYFASPNIDLFEEIRSDKNIEINDDILLRGLKLFKMKYNYTPVEMPLLNMTDASQIFQKLFTRFVT